MSEFNSSDEIVQMMIPKFIERFGVKPLIAGRAPGRVNLIGEHIDYCGFNVFPMALEGKNTTVLITPTKSGLIRARNTDQNYPDTDLPIHPDSDVVTSKGWIAYVETIFHYYSKVYGYKLEGFDVLVHGLVPIASGLSSSAALICSIAIALNCLHGSPEKKQDLVQTAIQAERKIGINCGGMDQSISILAKKGYACIIGFHPITAEYVKLPPAHFIVAHTMKSAAKIEEVDPTDCYNWRVQEVARCAQLMKEGCKTLAEVVKSLDNNFDEAIKLAETLPEVDENEPKLVLRKRALHVLTEARRVLQMNGADLKTWGKLMCESHASCRDLYHCSCKELDELVDVGMKAGAMGGRLTGAGWGGSTVFILDPSANPDEFIQNVIDNYYKKHGIENPIIFPTSPAQGAQAFKLE